MNTLEEEIIIPLQRQMEQQASLKKKNKLSPKWQKFWKSFVTIGLVLCYGVILFGLWKMERHSAASVKRAITSFRWIVMAEGDPVAIDEVGAFLKKIDGVGEVTFVSADEMYEKIRNDSLLANDLSTINGNPFPAAWNVAWKPSEFDTKNIQASLEDVRIFPSVVDVVSDTRALEKIQTERILWQRLQRVLALTIVAAILSVVALVLLW